MAEAVLTQTRIRAGVWEGILTGAAPALQATHLGRAVPGLEVTPLPDRPGERAVRLPIPVSALSEGVQTFLITDAASGAVLAQFAVSAGAPLDEDLRAEIDLLRAEFDMLKRAFRRHCLESGG